MPAVVVAALFLGHALIHASFLSPRPPATATGPQWPFDLAQSWLLTPAGIGEPALRALGVGLLLVIMVAFAVAAMATVGIAPAGAFVPTVAVGSIASIAMLALFFNPWLLLGFVIDAALLWATMVAGWRPGALAT